MKGGACMDAVVKDLLIESRTFPWLYSRFMLARGRWQTLYGQRLKAMSFLLNGWRAAGLEGFGLTGVRCVRRLVEEACYCDGKLMPSSGNKFLAEFIRDSEAEEIRAEFASYSLRDRVRNRFPNDQDEERQGNLILLKRHNSMTGEKGVILVKYTYGIKRFAAIFDLTRLAARYSLVLEPSWWGYQDTTFLLFLGSDLEVLVQSPWRKDWDFIEELGSNLSGIRLGAGDWIDPRAFRPLDQPVRTYDLVMVSAWSRTKRHNELFRTLAELKRSGRRYKVALVGYAWEWTRDHIQHLMQRHGVSDCCTVFEKIPQAEVGRIVADSRAYVLLSRREGANKALYEALFCNTPVIVYRHHRGVNTDHVTDQVGVLFESHRLADAIRRVLDGPQTFRPREWALHNTGYANSTRILNDTLRERALQHGLPWTIDINEKMNAPTLKYAQAGLYREYEEEYAGLASYLLPVSTSLDMKRPCAKSSNSTRHR
jgi:glycosyltransferase involved in cell wall biosynthesis